ncbi:MAG: DUF4153 domain-containing protein, partial [Ruminococcus sp.]
VLIFALCEGAKLKAGNVISLIALAAYPVSFILSDNSTLKGWGVLFMFLGLMMWTYYSCAEVSHFRQTFLYDFVKSVFVAPVHYFPTMPLAIIKPAMDSKRKILRYVLIGLVIALPITTVIAMLLVSSDESFRQLLGDDIVERALEFVWHVVLAVPVGMLIFSVFLSASRSKESVKARDTFETGRAAKVNSIIVTTVYVPVILLYLTYFFSQMAYFIGAFRNILPADYTYAEYARQGFFELCAVVSINVAMIILTLLFCRKKENGHPGAGVKAVVTVLSLCSIMLVSICISKMFMYTSAYGLTHKRIYTLWFTVVLAILVIVAFVKVMAPKFKFWSAALTALLVMYLVLSFANTDAIIAKYNVKWYKEGKISWMGEEALYDLSKSAVPYLEELVNDKTEAENTIVSEYRYFCENYYDDDETETVGSQIRDYYRYLASYDITFENLNVPAKRAEAVFKRQGIEAYSDTVDGYEI